MNQPLLSVNNLTHLYAPGKGFSDVSFDLWPGEVLGIVGESGSGKTTLLKSISARLRHYHQLLNFADPVDMMQMKLQMQADHADNFAIKQRQMVAHVWVAQIGVKTHAKRVVVKLRLF